MPGTHAILSPSSSERWINCPPSAKENAVSDTGSTYTQQGTDAHALCEYKVKKALGHKVCDPTPDLEFYDEEMEECATAYCEFIMEQVQAAKESCPDPLVLVEQRLDFTRWVAESFGTADCICVADGTMTVVDFKYGLGVLVDAKNNSQMRMYALGALNLFESLYDIQTVRMIIFQPRRDNVSIAEVTKDELLRWADEVLTPAAALAAKGEGEYRAGKHCQFCKIKATCRKRVEFNLQTAQYDFAVPDTLADDEISMILDRADTFIGWVNDIKAYALEQAISGKQYPGFKVVEGRSNRRYTDTDAVAAVVSDAGYDPYEKKLMGVTAMTKLLGTKKFNTLLGSLIEKPKGKPTLVPESDKRRAYAGCYFINANSATKPGVVDADCQPILDTSELYSGIYGRASINFYAFNTNGNKGIACGLNNLQKLRDGNAIKLTE